MKTLRIVSLLIVAALMFSCEKDVKEEKMGEVSFGIEYIAPEGTKDSSEELDYELCPDDMYAVSAEIVINGETYNPVVFYLDGMLYTQAIRLEVGSYTVSKFVIKNEAGNPIMATPELNSTFAKFVEQTVDFSFTVEDFEKKEVKVEVLCFVPAAWEAFGFNWFYIEEIVIREICFFGDLCHKNHNFFANTIYEDVFTLNAYPFDIPALFEVVVKKDDREWTFRNWDDDNNIAPLCVTYPDLINEDYEEFTFELWIYIPVYDQEGDFAGVEPVLFETWVLEEELINVDGEDKMLIDWSSIVNEFNIVEFVVGSCQYEPGENVHVFNPWQHLPETAVADINFNYADGGYWTIEVTSVSPTGNYDFPSSGTYLGWCGDPTETIGDDEHTFFIYSSLRKNTAYGTEWPGDMPTQISLESLARVNWLMNNLHTIEDDSEDNLGYPRLEGLYVTPADLNITADKAKALQHAIWRILGYTESQFPEPNQGGGSLQAPAEYLIEAANEKDNFVPLPGEYAAVLMVAKDDQGNPDPANNQLIFTVVDP